MATVITLFRRRKGAKEPERLQLETIKAAKHAAFGFKSFWLQCESCQMTAIQGIACHEHGCPQAWRDETKGCKWCGTKFQPTQRGQEFCQDSCGEDYHG